MQLGVPTWKMGLNIYLTELLGELYDINGIIINGVIILWSHFMFQQSDSINILLLPVATEMTERQRNQKSKILD